MIENNCFDNGNIKNTTFVNKMKDEEVNIESNEFIKSDNNRKSIQEDFNNLYEQYKNKLNNKTKKKMFDFERNDKILKSFDDGLMNFGIIIEGSSISLCLEKEISPYLWRILKKSRSVICCRCSPLQKAEVVRFIKRKGKAVTLAIGDGGNDVSMIKTANIGIGIFGKEGYQAAYNADYAIAQFKYLRNLLFNHGRYALHRNSYFIYYYFYKNVIYTFPQFWFSFFTGFSGSLLWDDWYYLGFNSFLSTVPIAVRTIFEEDIDIKFKHETDSLIKEISSLLVPDIYREYRDDNPFNTYSFFLVFLGGVIHSIIMYFVPFLIYKYGINDKSGRVLLVYIVFIYLGSFIE